ncbi:phospholipase-like, Aminotransferase-like mobile domain protein [Artemisia annua]|uniref:Phospholipase-like, Aminotransferase-like mobile domain protein n=1 Tax=Artemisia annua TaxID=35608 RepID=A0A2U1M7B6_ARTAN|nr:phospholipase-like, Aminotransferase-like mobile domain protein [Artemisia annua]
MWYDRDYEAKLIIRSKLNYFWLINQKLDAKRRNLFRSNCFRYWLDLLYFEHEPHLIDYMVRKQHRVDDSHYDMPFIYYLDGHTLHFGRPEFCLMTGLRFGSVSFEVYTSSDLKFRERVFPDKQWLIVTNLDLIGVLEDEERFWRLSDEDAIRISLLLVLEVIFMGRLLTCQVDDTLMRLVENLDTWNAFPWGEHIWTHLYDQLHNVMDNHTDKHLLGLKKNPTSKPTYTLGGFVFAFQIWILETFESCERWCTKNRNVTPRAIAWSRKSIFKRSDRSSLFTKDSTTRLDLRPNAIEYECSWWIDSQFFFQKYVPRATVTFNYTLVDAYLNRLAKELKRVAESLKVNSTQCRPSNGLTTKRLKDRVMAEMNGKLLKLEIIIQCCKNIMISPEKLDIETHFPNTRYEFCESLNKVYRKLITLPDSDEELSQEYLIQEELRLALAKEVRLQIEHEKVMREENLTRQEEAKRLRLEEENMLKLEEEKKQNRIAFFNSEHYQRYLASEYLIQEELRLALAEEVRLQIEHEKVMREENLKRQEEAKRLRLEEENMLKLEEEKKQNRIAFFNSEHYQRYLASVHPSKRRNYLQPVSESNNAKWVWQRIKKHDPNVNDPAIAELLTRVQPWVEDLSRWFHSVENVWLTDEIEVFLGQPSYTQACKFPWSDDYTVDRILMD